MSASQRPLLRARFTAYDLSAEMLATVKGEADKRGLANVVTRQGSAERLPFADASFDMVLSRFSAHHWGDVPAALREVSRVLKPAGTAVFGDVASAWTGSLATPSCRLSRCCAIPHTFATIRSASGRLMFAAAGFTVTATKPMRLRIDFASWIARMRTAPVFVQANPSLADSHVGGSTPPTSRSRTTVSLTFDTAVFVANR